MGNCLASGPNLKDAVPECQTCHKRAAQTWRALPMQERRFWEMCSGGFMCRKCHIQAKITEKQQHQERQWLQRAKQELFPKLGLKKLSLKKIQSGRQWTGTESFLEPHQPSKKVQELEQQLQEWETMEAMPVSESLARSTPMPISGPRHGLQHQLSSVLEDGVVEEEDAQGAEEQEPDAAQPNQMALAQPAAADQASPAAAR